MYPDDPDTPSCDVQGMFLKVTMENRENTKEKASLYECFLG